MSTITERFKEAVISAFNRVYQQDGLEEDKLYPDPLNRLAAFLGLPHRKTFKRDKQTFTQLAYDFIGLQDRVSPAKKWLNRCLVPVVFLFNLVNLVFQTALSIVKLFTEFLPLALSQFFAREAEKIERDNKPPIPDELVSPALTPVSVSKRDAKTTFLIYLLKGLSFLMHALYFIGRSVTSPIEGVKRSWNLGNKLASKKSPVWARELLGVFFATLSILCTTVAYIILFPLLLKVGLNLLAKAGVNLSGIIPPQVMAVVKPLLTPIANGFTKLASLLSLSVLVDATVALQMSVALIAAIAVTVIGTPISRFLVDRFKSWWHEKAPIWNKSDAEKKAIEIGVVFITPKLLKLCHYRDKSLLEGDKSKEKHEKGTLLDSKSHLDASLIQAAKKESKPVPFTLFGAIKESGPVYSGLPGNLPLGRKQR